MSSRTCWQRKSKGLPPNFKNWLTYTGSVDAAWKVLGKRKMFRGAAWLMGGSILSGLSYVLAVEDANRTGQGTYWVLTGAF